LDRELTTQKKGGGKMFFSYGPETKKKSNETDDGDGDPKRQIDSLQPGYSQLDQVDRNKAKPHEFAGLAERRV